MNVVILMGRLVRDPEVRYSAGANATAVARFRLAVDRRFKREGQPDADFFNITAFGRTAEFVEKYFHQGSKIAIQGRIENNNYQDNTGRTVYGQQVIAENVEFAESKAAAQNQAPGGAPRQYAPQQVQGQPAQRNSVNGRPQTRAGQAAGGAPQQGAYPRPVYGNAPTQATAPAQAPAAGYASSEFDQNGMPYNRQPAYTATGGTSQEGFMNIPDGVEEEMPFNQ